MIGSFCKILFVLATASIRNHLGSKYIKCVWAIYGNTHTEKEELASLDQRKPCVFHEADGGVVKRAPVRLQHQPTSVEAELWKQQKTNFPH